MKKVNAEGKGWFNVICALYVCVTVDQKVLLCVPVLPW